MVAFFEQHTALQFEGGNKIPDTYGDRAGRRHRRPLGDRRAL